MGNEIQNRNLTLGYGSPDASATSIADVSTKNVIRFEDSTVRN